MYSNAKIEFYQIWFPKWIFRNGVICSSTFCLGTNTSFFEFTEIEFRNYAIDLRFATKRFLDLQVLKNLFHN